MDLQREQVEGIAVLSLVEPIEIDIGNCEEFKAAFAAALGPDDRQVVLDASKIEFFDSAGMGSLLSLQKRLKKRDGNLVLAGLNRPVTEVFQMVGFDVVFLTFPDVQSAVDSLET